jgi:hypothetical protein
MIRTHSRSLALFTLIATAFAACSDDSSDPAAADASAPSSNADGGLVLQGDSGQSPSGAGAGGTATGADSGSNPSSADSGNNEGGQGSGNNTGTPWDDLPRTTSFDYQGETDASLVPTLVAGRYGIACYKSFDANVPVGYGVLDFLESDASAISIEDLEGNVLNSVPWDGEGSLQFDTLLIVGVNANPATIGVTLDSTNGNITVTSSTAGDTFTECDNLYKEVGLPIPLAVFEQVAGEYSASRNAEMADITINDDGTLTYQVTGQDAIDKEWDGNDDWVRTLAFPNYVGAPSLPRDNMGVFELVIDGTSVGSQETVKFMFDYRIETQPLLSFQFQGGNQFKTNDNLEEPAPEIVDGLPDFFGSFAGSYDAVVSARIDGLNGPYADLPTSFEIGENVEFTVNTDGSIEVGGVRFEWDDTADQWMGQGPVNFLSVGDTQSFVQLNVDTDYRQGFQVQLRNVQFATDALEFTNFTFELPPN